MAKPLGFMYALGLDGLPAQVSVQGTQYVLETTVKHDFWAGTGFYRRADPPPPVTSELANKGDTTLYLGGVEENSGSEPQEVEHDKGDCPLYVSRQRVTEPVKGDTALYLPDRGSGTPDSGAHDASENKGSCPLNMMVGGMLPERVVVKFNRRLRLMGIPLAWIGVRLRDRESRAYAKLQDLPGIPALLGTAGETGFIHAYVEGTPLRQARRVPDDFFERLLALIDVLGSRGIAYVDTNKPENILVGDDGLPYLIDFQISFDASAWRPRWLGRWILDRFHHADVYHALKHKRRYRPEQVTDAERRILERLTFTHRLHRLISKPYFLVRRPVMRWLETSGRAQKLGSD